MTIQALPPVMSFLWKEIPKGNEWLLTELLDRLAPCYPGLWPHRVYRLLLGIQHAGGVFWRAEDKAQRGWLVLGFVRRKEGGYRLSVFCPLQEGPETYFRSLAHCGVRRWLLRYVPEKLIVYIRQEQGDENSARISCLFQPTPELGAEPPLEAEPLREDPGRIVVQVH